MMLSRFNNGLVRSFSIARIVPGFPADRLGRSAPWGIGGGALKYFLGVGTKPHACKAPQNTKKTLKPQITTTHTHTKNTKQTNLRKSIHI